MELYVNPKIVVKDSKIHGRGVFAKEDIFKDEILEECHFIFLENKWMDMERILQEYVFSWIKSENSNTTPKSTLVLGNGMIYNSSRENNANWLIDINKNVYRFFAVKDIKKGEEICTFYGYDYERVVKSF